MKWRKFSDEKPEMGIYILIWDGDTDLKVAIKESENGTPTDMKLTKNGVVVIEYPYWIYCSELINGIER